MLIWTANVHGIAVIVGRLWRVRVFITLALLHQIFAALGYIHINVITIQSLMDSNNSSCFGVGSDWGLVRTFIANHVLLGSFGIRCSIRRQCTWLFLKTGHLMARVTTYRLDSVNWGKFGLPVYVVNRACRVKREALGECWVAMDSLKSLKQTHARETAKLAALIDAIDESLAGIHEKELNRACRVKVIRILAGQWEALGECWVAMDSLKSLKQTHARETAKIAALIDAIDESLAGIHEKERHDKVKISNEHLAEIKARYGGDFKTIIDGQLNEYLDDLFIRTKNEIKGIKYGGDYKTIIDGKLNEYLDELFIRTKNESNGIKDDVIIIIDDDSQYDAFSVSDAEDDDYDVGWLKKAQNRTKSDQNRTKTRSMEPDNSLSMGDEHLDTIPATESDEFIKSGVENLIPIPSESEGIPEHVSDVPSHGKSSPLDVSKDQIEDFFESNKEFSSNDDDSFSIDDIDYVEASPP
nr:hypothetical protein [Tanacetum cinerariifolium]